MQTLPRPSDLEEAVPVVSGKDSGQVPQGGVMFDLLDRKSYVQGIRSNPPEACLPKSVKTEGIFVRACFLLLCLITSTQLLSTWNLSFKIG